MIIIGHFFLGAFFVIFILVFYNMYCIVIELIRSAIAIQITKNNITIEKISSDAHPANPIGFAPPLEEELNFEEEDDVPDG